MSQTVDEKTVSELAEGLGVSPERLTESYDGEGTTHRPITEYLNSGERINYIFTAKSKTIALNNKRSSASITGDGSPTYVFTDSRVLAVMPKDDDEICNIPYQSIESIENHFGWLKWRIEVETSNESYHLWVNSSHNNKEAIKNAKRYVFKKIRSAKDEAQEGVDSVRSELSEIDPLISDSKLEKADSRLDDAESRFNSLKQDFPEVVDEKNVKKVSGLITEKRQTINYHQEVSSIKSKLSEVDSLISDSELKQAESQLSDVESQVDSVAQKLNTNPRELDEIRGKVKDKRQKIRQRESKSSQARDSAYPDPLEPDSEANNITSSRQSPKPKKQVDKTLPHHKRVPRESSNDSKAIGKSSKRVKSQNQASQAQEQKSKFNQEISSLESKLPEVDSLTSDSELKEAKEKLNDTESQVDSLKHQFPQFSDSEKVQNISDLISQKQRQIQRQNPKQQLNQKVSSLESKFSEIDSLISERELQEAKKRLEKIESQVDSVAQKLNTNPRELDELRGEVKDKKQKIRQRKSKSSQARDLAYPDPLEADSEANNITPNRQSPKPKKQVDKIPSQHEQVAQKPSNNSEYVNKPSKKTKNKNKRPQQQERKSKFKEKINSICTELSEIDSLISDSELKQSKSQLSDVESQLDSVKDQFPQFSDSEKVQNILNSINQKKRKTHKQQFNQEISSVKSELSQVDIFITDAEYHQAQELRDEISSEISSLKQQASQDGLDNHAEKLKRLKKESDNRLSKSNVLTQLRRMDAYEFEELVAKIWEKQGWDAEVTSKSTDRGVDIIAIKQELVEKHRHLIQAKKYGKNTKVGSEAMQKYSGLYQRNEQVDNVIIVTSNHFTSEAKEVAKNRDVSTVNADELYEILADT
jgi:HJR/Mrr/RecB family endonuclease/tetrahydromethanopterin S-methyltransferase subunit G